jgi:hypothetical protein
MLKKSYNKALLCWIFCLLTRMTIETLGSVDDNFSIEGNKKLRNTVHLLLDYIDHLATEGW